MRPFAWLAALTVASGLQHPVALSEALRLDGVVFRLEEDSYDKVRAVFGPALLRNNGGDAAGSLHFICYEGRDGTRLYVVGNEMVGPSANGFQLLDMAASFTETDFIHGKPHLKTAPLCDPSERLSKRQRLGAGLRLGLSRDAVAAILGRPARVEGDRLIYETETEVSLSLADGGPLQDGVWTRNEGLIVTMAHGAVVALSGFRVTHN